MLASERGKSRRCRNRWRTLSLTLLFILSSGSGLKAQQAPAVRVYLSNPADEDWSFLKESAKVDFWDPVKYMSLGGDRYLTLSGEIRFRPEGFRVRAPEGEPSTTDQYLLQRYLFGADLHLSRRFRFFGELQSGIASGKLRSPRPRDQNPVDVHQLFFEWRHFSKQERLFGIKVGRQEVEIGSSRLISASPGLNVKRSFDGVSFDYRGKSWRFGAVLAKLVSIRQGQFDDRPDHEQTFWGMAASRKSIFFKQGQLGFYYLNVDRARSLYAQGFGRDRRHTAGVKWSGSGGRADVNYDAILQWGSFNDSPVRAWAFSTETGYRLTNTRWRPRFAARFDIASGDKDPGDPSLQSFNPLFPGNSYAGAVGLLGPTNLTDVTPAVTLMVRRSLVLSFESPVYWRTSLADGVYNTEQKVLLMPSVGNGKYLGANPAFIAVWQATKHLQFQGVVSRFLPGDFIKNTFVANGFGFYSSTALYRF